MRVRSTLCVLTLPVAALFSCTSPLVGGVCEAPLAPCGGLCVDLSRSTQHCGACGITCGSRAMCLEGQCVSVLGGDAAVGTAEPPPVAGEDGGVQGAPEDASTGFDGEPPEDGTPCDGTACTCGEPLRACNGACVDTMTDPDHCGGCDLRCESGICEEGSCVETQVGHLVVIGHDYSASRAGMNRLAGNAVFLSSGAPVRVLAFEGRARRTSVRGVRAAIDQVAEATGRSWTSTVAHDATEVEEELGDHDVLLIHAQASGSDEDLQALGRRLAEPLERFLQSRGIVILFDGSSRVHGGTYQVLEAAQLFHAAGVASVGGDVLSVVNQGDAVALGVPLTYRAEAGTVRFEAASSEAIVTHPDGPVVIHRIVFPDGLF